MDDATKLLFEKTLDPHSEEEWEAFRETSHEILDEMINHLKSIRKRKVWEMMPQEHASLFDIDSPTEESNLSEVFTLFSNIFPYTAGNVHPGFMGWVQGGGNHIGESIIKLMLFTPIPTHTSYVNVIEL